MMKKTKVMSMRDLRRERDAAIADINLMGGCPICKHNVGRSDRTGLPICEKKREYPSSVCFEWRGFQAWEAKDAVEEARDCFECLEMVEE